MQEITEEQEAEAEEIESCTQKISAETSPKAAKSKRSRRADPKTKRSEQGRQVVRDKPHEKDKEKEKPREKEKEEED